MKCFFSTTERKGEKMTISKEQISLFIGLVTFVFWEPADLMHSQIARNYKAMAKHYKVPIWVPSGWFPPIWFVLKSCVVASYFTYNEYTVTTAMDFPYMVMFAVFFVNVALAKMWMPLFFRMQRYMSALVVSALLCATAWVYFGIAIANINMRPDSLYLVPALVWLPYALWLSFALVLNFQWAQAAASHLHEGGRRWVEEPLLERQK